MSNYRCCGQPSYRRAWVPCRPFRAIYCEHCGEVTMQTGPVLSWLFAHLFSPFWDGTIRVDES